MSDPLPTRLTEIGRPAQFYVREKEGDLLFGPLDFNSMDRQAREASKTNASRMAQVVVLYGTRTGDPARNPSTVYVKYTYVNGRRLHGTRSIVGPVSSLVNVGVILAEDGSFLLTEGEDTLITNP